MHRLFRPLPGPACNFTAYLFVKQFKQPVFVKSSVSGAKPRAAAKIKQKSSIKNK